MGWIEPLAYLSGACVCYMVWKSLPWNQERGHEGMREENTRGSINGIMFGIFMIVIGTIERNLSGKIISYGFIGLVVGIAVLIYNTEGGRNENRMAYCFFPLLDVCICCFCIWNGSLSYIK